MRIIYAALSLFLLPLTYTIVPAQDIRINEILSSNSSGTTDEDGDYSDWIELFNAGDTAIALEGYGLSDSYGNPFKWTFPAYTLLPGDYLLIWASGKDRKPVQGESELHTSYSIGAEGEEILLTTPGGIQVDEIAPVAIPTDISYGRSPDGSDTLKFFPQPTAGSANTTQGYSEILHPPVFSHTGGFYSQPLQLSLSTPQDDGVTIVYTLDASTPDATNLFGSVYNYKNHYREFPGSPLGLFYLRSFRSHAYIEPIEIRDRSEEPNQISNISSTYSANPWYFPGVPVEKATVVKAMAIKDGALASPVVSHTYFVNTNGLNPHALPVISLSATEEHLFDFEKGIYTAGEDFEAWRSANPEGEANGIVPANYHRRGDAWEYPAYFEFFDASGNRVLGQNMGFRIHGAWSRSFPMKTLRLYARNEYGTPYFNYPFFADEPYTAYKRLLLRNSGNDFFSTMFRDAALQEIVRHMDIETMAYQPAAVYLNGEYWGLHNIRERLDKHYFARKYGVDEEHLDIIEGPLNVQEGDVLHYAETLAYIEQNGVVDHEHYEHIKTRIDIENFIDYTVAQIFIVNTDWPGNNIEFWRLRTPDFLPEAGKGRDGRWRWMLFDTDFGFGMYDPNSFTFNMMEFVTQSELEEWPNPSWSTFLFRKLLENESFRIAFINRFADQLNSAFKPSVVRPVIQQMRDRIAPEMVKQIQRWKNPGNMGEWHSNVNRMLGFADQRPFHARSHLRQHFGLSSDYILTVDVSHPNHGYVIVNTLPIHKNTRGVAANPYPWKGTYFRDLPIHLEAVAAQGYEFVRWEGSGIESDQRVIEVSPGDNLSVTAVFRRAAQAETVVHYWNFNTTEDMLSPSYTLLTAGIEAMESDESETTNGTGQGFTGVNARFGDEAGSHLRINNPIGSSLVFSVPTTGFSAIKIKYETRRSGQGAATQIVEYTVDGIDFEEFQAITIADDDPGLVTLDFTAIDEVNNNADFGIRISFEQGSGGIAGNNRFDNITLEGIADDSVNLPPFVLSAPGNVFTIEGSDAVVIDLRDVFEDPEGDFLTYFIAASQPGVTATFLENAILTITIAGRGDSEITLSAYDGTNTPVDVRFRVFAYPEAFDLAAGNFVFDYWDPELPEMTFPENMMFLQSDINDPQANDPLNYAYFIPGHEYGPEDAGHIGFPYKNTSRTRLNGLHEEGISLINTGRGRDLGGVLLALNTTGLDEIQAQWLAGTILRNSRVYGIRLQYRVGHEGPFLDLPNTGYTASSDGDLTGMGPFVLPSTLLNKEYVQLLWRYHHISGGSGPRAQLSIDDITVTAAPERPVITHPQADATVAPPLTLQWNAAARAQRYELQISRDETFDDLVAAASDLGGTDFEAVGLEPGYYFARVRAWNKTIAGAWSEITGFNLMITADDQPAALPAVIKVYPNPFDHSTGIALSIARSTRVELDVYTPDGRKMMRVAQGDYLPGHYSFTVDGYRLPPGMYIVVCRTGQTLLRKKMTRL